ncbi:MAG: fatty acid metabolism transcriptional regulator FadR [Anaerolineales bacterium]|nr:fatty acid metabolism transcriptional regulator FadR [Anaerolineales bacterium]
MTTNGWAAPQRPNNYAEETLVRAILDGTFAPGTALPGERTLAAQLGVTRPTLREAIQRLARDGWLTVQHGKQTLVRNYWQDGGLNVLSTLVQHSSQLPPAFVTNLLDVRLQLAPAYTQAAVSQHPTTIASRLANHADLPDEPPAFAAFDWQLHRQLTILSGNPIYTLILNGFADFYEQIAQLYFMLPTARAASRGFYAALQPLAAAGDAAAAETLTRQVMQRSIALWQQTQQEAA